MCHEIAIMPLICIKQSHLCSGEAVYFLRGWDEFVNIISINFMLQRLALFSYYLWNYLLSIYLHIFIFPQSFTLYLCIQSKLNSVVLVRKWTIPTERPQPVGEVRLPLWSSGQSSWLQIQRSRVPFPALSDFLRSSGSGTGSTQPREDNWGATWMEK
jgi:hypothetical protein